MEYLDNVVQELAQLLDYKASVYIDSEGNNKSIVVECAEFDILLYTVLTSLLPKYGLIIYKVQPYVYKRSLVVRFKLIQITI